MFGKAFQEMQLQGTFEEASAQYQCIKTQK